MFHRELFNYLRSVNCANAEPDVSEAFFNPHSEYLISEFFRLQLAHESEHESVGLLSYEYAKVLTLIRKFMDKKDTGKIHDLILRHRFNTSHLFCVVNELELESLATGQSYNYSWTIDNNATSTSQDIMRCFVDDIIEFVNSGESLSKGNLSQYLAPSKNRLRHKSLFRLLKNAGCFRQQGSFQLCEIGMYIVREYCRILIIEEGLFNFEHKQLVNSFSAFVGKIYEGKEDISTILKEHKLEIESFYEEKHESLLDSLVKGNVVNIENTINHCINITLAESDTNRNQVDMYIEWALESKIENYAVFEPSGRSRLYD